MLLIYEVETAIHSRYFEDIFRFTSLRMSEISSSSSIIASIRFYLPSVSNFIFYQLYLLKFIF